MKLVYLAGPITGLDYEEARNGWRREASERLEAMGIAAMSPMRHKDYLQGIGPLSAMGYAWTTLSSPKGIVARDRYDSRRSDLTIMNLLGAKKVSIGTMIEVGWADAFRVPLVVIMEPDGSNVHQHGMVTEIASYIVPDLATALDVTRAVLVPGA